MPPPAAAVKPRRSSGAIPWERTIARAKAKIAPSRKLPQVLLFCNLKAGRHRRTAFSGGREGVGSLFRQSAFISPCSLAKKTPDPLRAASSFENAILPWGVSVPPHAFDPEEAMPESLQSSSPILSLLSGQIAAGRTIGTSQRPSERCRLGSWKPCALFGISDLVRGRAPRRLCPSCRGCSGCRR